MKVFSLMLACTAAALVLVGGAAAWHTSSVRHVSPKGHDTGSCQKKPCRTIGYAVGQANPGDTIDVDHGTYGESVLVTKRLSLTGHHATIDAAGHDNGVVISSDGAAGTRLSGFTVANADLEGVLAVQTSHLKISDNKIVHNDQLWDPDNIPEPCQSSDDCGEALHLLSVTHSKVKGNLVADNVGGILLTDEAGPTSDILIADNWVLDNEEDCGITLASHAFNPVAITDPSVGGVYDNIIVHNTSNGNGAAGIGVFAGPPGANAFGNLVVGNRASGNGLPGVAIHDHVPLANASGNAVIANVLSHNGPDDDANTVQPTGLTVFGGAGPIAKTIVGGNWISHEYYGIFTVSAVSLPGLGSNHFFDVTVPVSQN